MDINIEAHNLPTLEKWLELLELRTTGSKDELVARLNDVPSTLQGRAHDLLHANGTRILEPVDNICEQLVESFGKIVSQADARRLFVSRIWSANESFVSYIDEKARLSDAICISEEERVDKAIEGIPVEGLRIQAQIQRFKCITELRCAFSGIQIPVQRAARETTKVAATGRRSEEDFRCYNCNSKGHMSKDCKKPDKVPGSSFGCGALDHWVAKCPLNKEKLAKGCDDGPLNGQIERVNRTLGRMLAKLSEPEKGIYWDLIEC
ncbi:uncharacterized protein LOC124459901 [Drosophila willistoni]|uniref:uncharacterized protein LOC124459901 n=1 Tax=Drosophila willistoni TaxID=7260 RepID=UPI001F076315|nr:uncharacterized protein LOC124459901 [Drosophila willistoni]